MFLSMIIIRELVLELKSSVKISLYKIYTGVAAYCVKSILVWMQCVVQNETELCCA
jgi:hypothetical protein